MRTWAALPLLLLGCAQAPKPEPRELYEREIPGDLTVEGDLRVSIALDWLFVHGDIRVTGGIIAPSTRVYAEREIIAKGTIRAKGVWAMSQGEVVQHHPHKRCRDFIDNKGDLEADAFWVAGDVRGKRITSHSGDIIAVGKVRAEHGIRAAGRICSLQDSVTAIYGGITAGQDVSAGVCIQSYEGDIRATELYAAHGIIAGYSDAPRKVITAKKPENILIGEHVTRR